MFLVVSTSAVDCLERLVSEMTYYVSSGTLNPTHTRACDSSSYGIHTARLKAAYYYYYYYTLTHSLTH